MNSKVTQRPSLILKSLLIFFSALLIIFSLWKLLDSRTVTREWPIYIVSLVFVWLCVYIAVTYTHFKTLYLFTSAYIISLLIFHLGHVVLHSFGWENIIYYKTGSMAIWYERAGWCTLLAVASLGLGVGLTLRSRVKTTSKSSDEDKKNLSAAYWIGIGLLAASFVSLVITFATVGNILQFTRTEIFGGAATDIRGFGFFILVMPSAIILMVVGAVKKNEKWIAYSLAVFAAIALLLLGYRSSALFSGLIGAILWVKVGKRIPVVVAVSMILFVLVVIPTVRYLRDLGTFQDVTQAKVVESYKSTGMKEAVQEVGGVNGIIANVLQWVPENEPFWYGQSYKWALTKIFPNLGFSQSASGRNKSSTIQTVKNKEILNSNPAVWYIYNTNRWKFDHGLGSGFSTIAEPYLNFGYPGIVFYFTLLGFLLCKLDHVNLRAHPKALIFSGAMLWPFIKTVRNSFVVFIKPLGLILAAIIIWRLLTFWRNRR